MSDHEIDTLVAAADPLDEAAPAAIDEATLLGLRDAIVADGDATDADSPVPGTARGSRLPRPRGSGSGSPPVERRRVLGHLPRRRLLAGFAVAAVAVAAVFAVALRDPGDSGTAWAAPLVRLAESSPLLLLDLPGWHVTRADESDEVEGEMTFTRGTVPTGVKAWDMPHADLNWRHGSVADWQRDRAHDAALVVRRTVLGAPAQVSQYPEYSAKAATTGTATPEPPKIPEGQGIKDFTAIWPEDGRVLEFRAVADDLAAFERLLAALKRVDVDTWLSAMPASVVKSGNRSDVVKAMLADIPQPPGFDPSALEHDAKVSDRYQLGAQVAGAVSCAWIARWGAARKRGDEAVVKEAVEAMRSARRWKILVEMDADGDYTEVVVDYAKAMAGDGTWYGRPLLKESRSGLGCPH